jgi:hypothetical protein
LRTSDIFALQHQHGVGGNAPHPSLFRTTPLKTFEAPPKIHDNFLNTVFYVPSTSKSIVGTDMPNHGLMPKDQGIEFGMGCVDIAFVGSL